MPSRPSSPRSRPRGRTCVGRSRHRALATDQNGNRGVVRRQGGHMRRRWMLAVVVGYVSFAVATPTAGANPRRGQDAAATKDYAQTALNILPAGQYGAVPPPPEATQQAD